jgi:hypothetical protein
MAGKGVTVMIVAAMLLGACGDPTVQPEASGSPAIVSCGMDAPVPEGATLTAADVGSTGGAASSRYTVFPDGQCTGIAVRPDRCAEFPWVAENDLYALGGRSWLVGTVGGVHEQIVLYAPDSSFAATYQRAAESCDFSAVTVLNGKPVTMQRTRDGASEVVYLTGRSVIWLSSADPAIGAAELLRLASVAEDNASVLSYPS